MKPAFGLLHGNFHSATTVKREVLFAEIGWKDLVSNNAYKDTCAIRMSLALIKSGMRIPGRMPIKAGPHKGKMIEPGQAKLSAILARADFLGKPEVFDTVDAEPGIGSRSGIVSFFELEPAVYIRSGHIDLVRPDKSLRACASSCFWNSKTVWFWAL